MRRQAFAVVSAVIALLPACFTFPPAAFLWARDEHHWRIDGERDVVEWIEIEHGLTAPNERTVEQLARVLAGERVFPPNGGWLSLSFDERPAPETSGAAPRFEDSLDALAPTVRVVEARLVLDEDSLPSLWRRTRIEHASAWLLAFQDALFEDLDRAGPESTFEMPGELTLDAADVALLREALSHGLQVWKLDESAFVMELPMTPETARSWLLERDRNSARSAVPRQSEASYSDGWLRVRHVPDVAGWITADPYDFPARDCEPAMLARLDASKLCVESSESYAALRRAAGLR